MSLNDKGAFCQSCQKQVHDFSQYSNLEIKQILEQKNVCVRTTQNKLDELNFIEWFNHLKLKPQLKYLFLFSFLIACNSLNAQESTRYEPQFITLDSSDQLTADEIYASIRNDVIPEEAYEPQIIWEPGTMIHWQPTTDEYELEVVSVSGSVQINTEAFIYGDIGWIGTIVVEEPAGIHVLSERENQSNLNHFSGYNRLNISNEAALFIEHVEFEFIVEGDQLLVYAKSAKDQLFTFEFAKVEYFEKNRPILFRENIAIPQGENTLKLPLINLPKGNYSIQISTQNHTSYASFNYY